MSEQLFKINIDNNQVLEAIEELKELLTTKARDEKLIYTTKELSVLLGYENNTNKIDKLRRSGAIKAIKKGQGYIFTKYSVEEFLRTFDGTDLSNDKAIDLAISKVKKNAPSHQDKSV